MGSGPVSCDVKHCTAFRLRESGRVVEFDASRPSPRNFGRLGPVPGPHQIRQEGRARLLTGTFSSHPDLIMIGVTVVCPWRQDEVTGFEQRDQRRFDVLGTHVTVGEFE